MTYCFQIEWIKVALLPNIDKQDRKAAVAICEGLGGKFLGMAIAVVYENYNQNAVHEVPEDVASKPTYVRSFKPDAFYI